MIRFARLYTMAIEGDATAREELFLRYFVVPEMEATLAEVLPFAPSIVPTEQDREGRPMVDESSLDEREIVRALLQDADSIIPLEDQLQVMVRMSTWFEARRSDLEARRIRLVLDMASAELAQERAVPA